MNRAPHCGCVSQNPFTTEVKGGSAAWMGKKELFRGKFHTDDIAVAAVNRKLPLRVVVRP